jgi:hypothetical protein
MNLIGVHVGIPDGCVAGSEVVNPRPPMGPAAPGRSAYVSLLLNAASTATSLFQR